MRELQSRMNVGAESEQINDIFECHCCAQFSWLIITYLIKEANRFRVIIFLLRLYPFFALHFNLLCSHATHTLRLINCKFNWLEITDITIYQSTCYYILIHPIHMY